MLIGYVSMVVSSHRRNAGAGHMDTLFPSPLPSLHLRLCILVLNLAADGKIRRKSRASYSPGFICGSTFYLVLVRKRQPPLSSLDHAPPLSTRKCWKANSFMDLIYTFDCWLAVNQDDAYVS